MNLSHMVSIHYLIEGWTSCGTIKSSVSSFSIFNMSEYHLTSFQIQPGRDSPSSLVLPVSLWHGHCDYILVCYINPHYVYYLSSFLLHTHTAPEDNSTSCNAPEMGGTAQAHINPAPCLFLHRKLVLKKSVMWSQHSRVLTDGTKEREEKTGVGHKL